MELSGGKKQMGLELHRQREELGLNTRCLGKLGTVWSSEQGRATLFPAAESVTE